MIIFITAIITLFRLSHSTSTDCCLFAKFSSPIASFYPHGWKNFPLPNISCVRYWLLKLSSSQQSPQPQLVFMLNLRFLWLHKWLQQVLVGVAKSYQHLIINNHWFKKELFKIRSYKFTLPKAFTSSCLMCALSLMKTHMCHWSLKQQCLMCLATTSA